MAHPAVPTHHNKRKRHDEASMERLGAQKLQQCADVTDAFLSTQRALNRQLQRYKAQKVRADELGRLHFALEQMTRFQTLFGPEIDAEKVHQNILKKQMEKLLTNVSNKKRPVPLRTQNIVRRMPRLMEKATLIVSERRQVIKEQQELPMNHQWVPMILWKIYHQVEKSIEKIEELKPLKTAMHEVLKTLKETNPFFYLQVLYQAPPEYLNGQWELTSSEKLIAISATMAPYFQELKRRSLALSNNTDSFVRIRYGWKQLRVTLTFVKRAARHFHCLILHLYAITMGRDEPNVHAGIISEKAAIGILSDSAKLRSRLKLCRTSANAEDNLLMETYEWTPELLVYLDQWRQYRDKQRIENFGFDRRERNCDFLPQFSGKNQSRQHSKRIPRKDVLAEIGYHFSCVHRVWRKSKLGTSRFKSMTIEDIGVLEKNIKSSFGMVVDLVYKMMLARWMDRRKRPTQWWASLQLLDRNCFDCEHEPLDDFPDSFLGDHAEDSQENGTQHSLSDTVELNENLQDDADEESREHKKSRRSRVQLSAVNGFRRPSTVTLVNHASTSKEEATELFSSCDLVMAKPFVFTKPIKARDVYAWTDTDVRALTRNTKRIADVRAAMVGLRDRFDWLKASREATSVTETETKPAFGESACDAWRAACIATHLCTLTKKAASFAEEAAIFEAASALTMKRSLQVPGDKVAAAEDNEDLSALRVPSDEAHIKELQENVRNAHGRVAELLSQYDGQQSTEWRDVILSTGLATAHLLRTISEDDIAHGLLADSNNGGG